MCPCLGVTLLLLVVMKGLMCLHAQGLPWPPTLTSDRCAVIHKVFLAKYCNFWRLTLSAVHYTAKNGGAWESGLVLQSAQLAPPGQDLRIPISVIVWNLNPPVGNAPALLTMECAPDRKHFSDGCSGLRSAELHQAWRLQLQQSCISTVKAQGA